MNFHEEAGLFDYQIPKEFLRIIAKTTNQGDAREESYYLHAKAWNTFGIAIARTIRMRVNVKVE